VAIKPKSGTVKLKSIAREVEGRVVHGDADPKAKASSKLNADRERRQGLKVSAS